MILNASVSKIIFSATDSSYKICLLTVENEFNKVTAKGMMNVTVGQKYKFTGENKEDATYGDFFQVQLCEIPEMVDGEDVINYLSSSKFDGIGRRTARKIHTLYGTETINIIENDIKRLIADGITERVVEEIESKHLVDNLQGQLYKLLTPLNINDYVINNIYDFGHSNKIVNFISVFKENPFKYIDKIYGFTFQLAETIYTKFNSEIEDYLIIKYFILNALKNYCYQSGDTLVPRVRIFNIIMNQYQKSNEEFNVIINMMNEEKLVYLFEDNIMHKEFHINEEGIAKNLSLRAKMINNTVASEIITSHIYDQEMENQINYSDTQKEAIEMVFNNNVSIITGGPGTGKTTIIKAVCQIYRDYIYRYDNVVDIREKILLCAPTGRASQRMKQATGFSARTIHSSIGWDPHKDTFSKNLDDQLLQDLIIIDEFSMVDVFLANALLKAIRPSSKIIFVGDPAQLESVSPGSVLRDLILSNKVTKTHLDIVYRQGEGSSIAKLAYNIDNNKQIEYVNSNDMSMISRNGALTNIIKKIVDKSLDAGYNDMQVQILYPKYKGINGIDNINSLLKPVLSESNYDKIKCGDSTFQVGDKVMQLKNNHDLEVYNGDIGRISQVHNPDAKGNQLAITVDFDRIKVDLNRTNLEELNHAYAISIHKSQGSEFPVVILPISSEASKMLSKKLIYTAITRAKDKLIIIGNMDELDRGINESDYSRKTILKDLLIKFIDEKSPYDFL